MRALAVWAIGLLPLIAAAAPVTVVEHTLDIQVDWRGRGTAEQVWTIRIDEVAGVRAGVLAPPGLDGATDDGARVLDSVLILPPSVEAGDTYTLRSERRLNARGDGGVFRLAPDLPTEHAELNVTASGRDVVVWADDGARFQTSNQRNRTTAGAEWDEASHGEAVWSSWPSWSALGSDVDRRVTAKLASRAELGRDLSSSAATVGESLAGIVSLVNQRVQVAPGDIGSLDEARDAAEVLQDGSGTAYERSLVLLSVLRELGHDARMGFVLPGPQPRELSPIPPTLAAFDRPAVVVVQDMRNIWIDPASEHATPPSIPAAFAMGTAWATGQAPIALPSGPGTAGLASIQGSATIGASGDLRWDATLTADGPAQEHLRRLLSAMPEGDREVALGELLTDERDSDARVDITIANLTRTQEPLRITAQMVEPAAFQQAGPGMQGFMQPFLAPALAAWLPPGVDVVEDVTLRLPDGLAVVGTPRPTSRHDDAGLVARTVSAGPRTLTLHTEASQRVDAPDATEVDRFFARSSRSALDVLLLPTLTRAEAKKAAKSPWQTDPVDQVATAVLLASLAGDPRTAEKAVARRAQTVGFDELVWRVSERSDASDHRALDLLWDVATTDDERIDVATAMAACCGERPAWLRLGQLVNTTDPGDRLRVLLMMLDVQPEAAPSARTDPEGNQAWFEPAMLLERAEQAHAEASTDGEPDPRLLRIRASRALDADDPARAEALLIDAMRLSRAPDLPILYARAGASQGVDVRETMLTVDEALASAPDDPAVLLAAADVLDRVGLAPQAVARRLQAAQLLYADVSLWSRISRDALAVSDLTTALHAALRASDLSPEDPSYARTLERLAWMAGDADLVQTAAARLGTSPRALAPLEQTLDAVAIEERAAVLEYRDEETRRDPARLGDRGLGRLSRGDVHAAARDGLWLQATYDDSRGDSIVAAATTGRMTPLVDTASDTDVSAALTLTRAIVLGSEGGSASARLLEDNAVAAVMRVWFRSSADVIGDFQAEPMPGLTRPAGYRDHDVLSGVPNVAAWTLPTSERALVVSSSPDLPPPLAQTVRRVHPAERRIPGGVIERLEGLSLPVYGARVRLDEGWAWGLGFTPSDAHKAARDAQEANPRR